MNRPRLTCVLSHTLLAAAALAALPAFAVGESATGNMPKMADPSQLTGLKPDQEAARPAIGIPLIEAERLIKDKHFTEAMVKVHEAERVTPDMSSYERYSISRTKAAALMGLGQTDAAFDATEAAIETKKLTGDAQNELIASLVHAAYAAKDYKRAVKWADRYAQEGGKSPDVATLRTQALYLGGDFAAAAAAMQAQMTAEEAAGRVVTERELQLLASAQRKAKDEAGVLRTIEQLATRYPKPAYWGDLLARVDRKTLSDRLFIDLFRLTRATGNLAGADEAIIYADVALQSGLAGEAVAVLDDAKAKGVFKAEDLKKADALRAKAAKPAADDVANRKKDESSARASKDGNALVFLGQSAVGEGRVADGVALMEQGFAKGGVRRAEEQRLRLGAAQAMAGNRDAAKQTLAAVKGPEGMTELAHLWWLYASASAVAP